MWRYKTELKDETDEQRSGVCLLHIDDAVCYWCSEWTRVLWYGSWWECVAARMKRISGNLHIMFVYLCNFVTNFWHKSHPFREESVGGWRKDEVQWMSLALDGNRKNIWTQKPGTSYRLWNVLSHHSSSFTVTSHVMRRTWWHGVKQMCGQGESRGTD